MNVSAATQHKCFRKRWDRSGWAREGPTGELGRGAGLGEAHGALALGC